MSAGQSTQFIPALGSSLFSFSRYLNSVVCEAVSHSECNMDILEQSSMLFGDHHDGVDRCSNTQFVWLPLSDMYVHLTGFAGADPNALHLSIKPHAAQMLMLWMEAALDSLCQAGQNMKSYQVCYY